MSSIPSFVREFNAASMTEAVIAADQALRKDGITVAIWKNFADVAVTPELRAHWQNIIERLNDENEKTSRRHIAHFFDDRHEGQVERDVPFIGQNLRDKFQVKGYINKSFSLIRTQMHQDTAQQDIYKDDPSLLFSGNPFRLLFNLEGRPTEFYKERKRRDPYVLPEGALAFFTYKKEESRTCRKASWHSGVDVHKPRTFLVVGMKWAA